MDVKKISACEFQVVKLECEEGKRIGVVNVFYGRLDGNTCSTDIGQNFLENTSCVSETATSTLSERCDGKKKCRFQIHNNFLGGDPCDGTFKYSDVLYTCQGS